MPEMSGNKVTKCIEQMINLQAMEETDSLENAISRSIGCQIWGEDGPYRFGIPITLT